MARGRKKATAIKTEQESVAIATVPPEQDVSVSTDFGAGTELPIADTFMPPPVEATASTVAELREATQEILDRSEVASGDAPQRERFRSWVSNAAGGYARWSDNEYQRIVLQFNEKPSQEILEAVKEAGFNFQPDYCGLKNAWVRRNDYTGRVRVDAIEKLIRAQTVGMELPAL